MFWWILATWGCGDGCPKSDLAYYRCPDGECREDCSACAHECEDGTCVSSPSDCEEIDTATSEARGVPL